MFGPKCEVLKLVELLSKQVLMRITGRMEKTGDKIYFLGRVIERTARGYSVEANPKYIQNVMNVLGLEEAKPVMTPSVRGGRQRQNHSLSWKAKDEHVQKSCGKTVVHVPGTSRHHVQREGNSKKDNMSNRE